ncbi:hypothetical protein [Microcella sp.]|uniref:hypothetical protein n=1 Tax=Microcella sp. TaxID=1913979 RepID=UPI002606177C|nr:hypothetical protein [Microcella sp.]
MSDSTSWASPGWRPDDQEGTRPAGDTGTAASQGASGTTASPGGYAPAGGPPPPQPAAGWTPPPKPGLIPLRPLDFGALLGATFQVLRRNPRPTFGAALLLNALVVIVAFGLTFGVTFWALDRAERASSADAAAIEAGAVGLVIVMAILAIAISLVAQALLQGVIVLEVSRATVGEKLTLRQLLDLGRGRWWALIGWTVLLSGALIVGMTLFFIVIVLMVAIGSVAGEVAGTIVAILFAIFGGLAFAAFACWLWIKLALVPAAIMLERLTLGAAVRRAWTLVIGHFWRTFGILLLITVMVQVASSVVSTPFSIAASFGGVLANPAGDDLTSLSVLLGANVLTIAITVVVGAIGAVLLSAATALIYLDLRMRKEGLDLELQRFVELRASGATAPDPYQPAAR